MSESIAEFTGLVDALRVPLPTEASRADDLRTMIAFAESNGVVIAQHVRTIKQQLADSYAESLGEVRKREDYAKSNADEKKLLLKSSVSELESRLEYMEKLEELIKRRCSLGQSLLNSLNTEIKSSFNK